MNNMQPKEIRHIQMLHNDIIRLTYFVSSAVRSTNNKEQRQTNTPGDQDTCPDYLPSPCKPSQCIHPVGKFGSATFVHPISSALFAGVNRSRRIKVLLSDPPYVMFWAPSQKQGSEARVRKRVSGRPRQRSARFQGSSPPANQLVIRNKLETASIRRRRLLSGAGNLLTSGIGKALGSLGVVVKSGIRNLFYDSLLRHVLPLKVTSLRGDTVNLPMDTTWQAQMYMYIPRRIFYSRLHHHDLTNNRRLTVFFHIFSPNR